MTPERLREIALRHADEVPDVRPSLMAWHPRHAQAHADRGELLALIQRIAETECYVGQAAVGECFYCETDLIHDQPHTPDCPAPALEALRCEAAQPQTTRT